MTYGLGVDLGTTFAAAAVARPTGVEMVTLGDHTASCPRSSYSRDDGKLHRRTPPSAGAHRPGPVRPRGQAAARRPDADHAGRRLPTRPPPCRLAATRCRRRVEPRAGAPADRPDLPGQLGALPARAVRRGRRGRRAGVTRLVTEPEAAAAHHALPSGCARARSSPSTTWAAARFDATVSARGQGTRSSAGPTASSGSAASTSTRRSCPTSTNTGGALPGSTRPTRGGHGGGPAAPGVRPAKEALSRTRRPSSPCSCPAGRSTCG